MTTAEAIAEAVEQLEGLLVTYVGTADMEGREIAREILHRGQLNWERNQAPKQ